MKRLLNSFGDGAPFFIYYISLFVTTGYFTVLCASIYSFAVFAVFSVLYITLKQTCAEKRCHRGKATACIGDIMSVSALVFSVLCETGTSVRIFTLASDADSGKSDLVFFAVIICAVSLIIAYRGMKTAGRIACFGWIVPLAVLFPCVISLIRYGTEDLIGFIAVGDLAHDILRGTTAFLLLISDFAVIRDSFLPSGKYDHENASLWSKGAVFFIVTAAAVLCVLFGRDMSRDLSSALMSGADASGGSVFDEVLLAVFSFCMILRLCMKMIVVYDKLKGYFRTDTLRRAITAVLITGAAGTGAYVVTRGEMYSFMIAQAILNLVSFILLPCLSFIFGEKNKYDIDDPI